MRRSSQILRCAEKAAETVAETKKESLLKKLGNHFKSILDDYKTVALETVQDMKDRPIKSGIYLSILGTTVALFKTNPDEIQFNAKHTQSMIDLMMVGDKTRNPQSQEVIDSVSKLKNQERLKYYNLGFCSLMCEREYGLDVGLYSANCKYVRPHWTQFHKTIVDVGVFGRWINLSKGMVDYDINPEEWLEDGSPNTEFKYYNKDSLIRWDMTMNN
ncbi:mitochondrial import inner membrane translocase subunit Tim29-like [Mya arenaria]|uniref:mitochondrial import inner membrane translocase subunit Tim29-like n=1 Tax=Mya arenaria TaxID=6604 RepID=UPI0022E238B3|nr:mitochondrial import inner membrane translocase subunit Tim29-like [Mya arenaria]